MRLSRAAALSALAASAKAYPGAAGLVSDASSDLSKLSKVPSGLLSQLTSLGENAVNEFDSNKDEKPTFNAKQQLVDVTGVHRWEAPGPNDARGPCPGLNALANHAYLPRNGFATIFDFVDATTNVYGMGLDLAAILAAYGAIFDGIGVGWSVEGAYHTGISGSHGHYETDSSPMRADLHQYGSNQELIVDQFQQFFDLQKDASTANYNIDVLTEFRRTRFEESVSQNPWFYYGPFSGTIVSQAAFSFIYRFMANHTAEAPEGVLNQDVLKSFFAVYGNSGSFVWKRGYERIPDNWYKRALNAPYGLNGLSDDIDTIGRAYPEIHRPGCNTGKVNSFKELDTYDTDSGAYDFAKPFDGVCYGIALAGSKAIDQVPIVGAVAQLVLLPFQNALGCPVAGAANASISETCPGYAFYGGPTGTVAPGAIQD